MNSREITLWLDGRWYDALSRQLKGETVEDKLNEHLDELINALIPDTEYSRISQEIWQEEQENKQAQEAARRFAVFHVTEDGGDTYFVAEENLEMLQVAARLRSYLRKPPENSPARFTGMFSRGEKISREQFNDYVSERLENTGRVTGAFDIDLDSGRFNALHIMDGWQCFRIRDVSSAAYYANKRAYTSLEERWKVFLNHLDGKQLTQEIEPGYLTGSRMLRTGDISFSGDIEQNENLLEFYLDTAFDVDKVFGTHVCTDENDDWLNIYANYDMQRQQVCDTLEITLYGSGIEDQSLSYHLNAAEKEVLREKMDAYCMQREHKPLDQLCQEILQEQDTPTQEMQM